MAMTESGWSRERTNGRTDGAGRKKRRRWLPPMCTQCPVLEKKEGRKGAALDPSGKNRKNSMNNPACLHFFPSPSQDPLRTPRQCPRTSACEARAKA